MNVASTDPADICVKLSFDRVFYLICIYVIIITIITQIVLFPIED